MVVKMKYSVILYNHQLVNPFCKQNDHDKSFITFETFPKKFFLIGHNGMTSLTSYEF